MPQLAWFKSSYSGSPNNECVECAVTASDLRVRDSKQPDDGEVHFRHDAWTVFTAALGEGVLGRR